jgi:eukaryotic-like serine/threonine-protein kinase
MAGYEGLTVFNYRLTRKLGEGGFGVVYLAEHVEIGRMAACKLLHPEFARQPELVERFFREVRAVCAIEHPAIVDVQNFGRLASGEPFYLMDYFPGLDLRSFVAQRGPLPLALVGQVFGPIASALAAAHAKQVVHRDLKPENILVRELPDCLEVRLLDFGVAKLMDSRASAASRTGLALGTPTYMAPEQARDAKSVDPRADVYSFGATIYSAVSGRPPFAFENLTDLIIAVQTQPPMPLQQVAPHVPIALDAVIGRCLAKQPAGRPPTISAAWEEIRAALGHAPAPAALHPGAPPLATTLVTPHSSPHAVFAAQGTPGPATVPPAEASRRRMLPVVGGAAVALVVLILLLVLAGRGDEEPAIAAAKDAPGRPLAPRSSAGAAASSSAPEPPSPEHPATPDPMTVPPPPAALHDARPAEEPPAEREPAQPAVPPPKPRRGTSSRECKPASFARVYDAGTVDAKAIEAALLRLRKCRDAHKVDEPDFKRIQRALVNRL